ncbi:MAG: hypothetical protein Q9M08_06765 [Mariprofundus sp.]|nr:hypothetical protein [Mariprofundus sp.]
MKTVIAAMAFMFALSANAGMAFAHDGEHDGYEQHESKDHGDKDRHEHGDKDKGRGGHHAAAHTIDQGRDGSHAESAKDSGSHFWDWLPF